ncbi:hypothetical protein KY285_030144 [Solanum tuberosum]|nr:hypothetical protein KY285_030144 [Solanum tuberosum]
MVDPQKIEADKNWVRPSSVTEIKNLVGLASYYRRGAVQPSKEVARRDDKAQFYAFPGNTEVETSYAVITCTILICDQMATVCLNLSSTCSYVSVQFALEFDVVCDVLDAPSMFPPQLKSMTWLYSYYIRLNCNTKLVTLEIPSRERLEWERLYNPKLAKNISFVRAWKLVGQGCLAYLAHIRDFEVESPSIESIPVVLEFREVFPTDLPAMPPNRDIDFYIDLETGTRPISIPPYRMDLAELRDLKAQIQELLDKGFIYPSASLWGALVLFVKKKKGSTRTRDFILTHK